MIDLLAVILILLLPLLLAFASIVAARDESDGVAALPKEYRDPWLERRRI